MIVNISEAKTHLSKLIDRVYHGQKVIIAKNNLPIAELILHKPDAHRQLGLLKGKLELPQDLSDGDEEIAAMFEQSNQ